MNEMLYPDELTNGAWRIRKIHGDYWILECNGEFQIEIMAYAFQHWPDDVLDFIDGEYLAYKEG